MGNPQFRFTLSHDTRASLAALQLWVNQGSGTTWVTGANPQVSTTYLFLGTPDTSKKLIGQITNGFPGSFTITYNLHVFRTSGAGAFSENVYIKLLDDAYAELATTTLNYQTEGTKSGSVVLTTTGYPKYVSVSTEILTFSSRTVSVDLVSMALSSGILSTKSISEPDGWKKARLILDRQTNFHSLAEYFESGFIFYGTNGIDDGGIDFIKNIEGTYGVDSNINVVAEQSFNDGAVWEEVFTGLLALHQKQEIKNNKMDVPVSRDSAWVNFIAHLDTPVNLRSTTDIHGNLITPTPFVNVNLTSQKLRQQYEGHTSLNNSTSYTITDLQYGQIDFEDERLNEIKDKYNYPLVDNPSRPFQLFAMEYEGSYNFNIVIYTGTTFPLSAATDANIQVRLQINDDTATVLTQTLEISGADSWRKHTYSGTLSLKKNDSVRLYFYNNNATGVNYTFVIFPAYFKDSKLQVTGNTVFPSTEAQGFLLHDAFAGVLQRITGSNSFYSQLFGSAETNMRTYSAQGCHFANVLLKGLQIRTYTLTEKPFFISFSDLWKGADPIFNLGLGYETIAGENIIRIEGKSHFYDNASYSVNIDNVQEIVKEYDNEKIFKKIEIGFSKWQSEDASGIDDPQTKHVYSTRFEKIGSDITILSTFIAASYAFEVTRRHSLKKSEDYKFDDDTFILAVNNDDVSPDRYRPELDENFDSVTGLLNSDTRYNIIHTPSRMLMRWANYFGGALQKYGSSSFRFASGEGNYSMTSDYSCTRGNICISIVCDPILESQNISLLSYGGLFGYIHLPDYFAIDIDLSWEDYKTIRDNKKKPPRISQTSTNHKKMFIKKLEYEVCNSKAKITGWAYEDIQLVVPESTQP